MAKDVIARIKAKDEMTAPLKKMQGSVKGFQGQMNNLNGLFGQMGGSMGQLSGKMGMVTQALTTMGGGYAALAAAVVGATAEFVKYNIELEKTDQMVTTITGATGSVAQSITDSVKALASTYGTDLKTTIQGVNTLMQQFGISGKEATDIVAKGFQGMLEGDQGNMLSMIQQFAPAFRDMGISASELVAIINNTEGGIFGPEGLAAIQMAGKKIREMSNTTKASLEAVGIDADDMTKKLSDGSITTIDALKQIATKIGELGPQSQEVGNIMRDVFGRQGANAGTQLVESIASLNTNLDDTKNQTGDVGKAMANLEQATERMNGALRDLAGMNGGFATMGTNIKTYLTDTMTGAMKAANTAKDALADVIKTISNPITDNVIEGAIRGIVSQHPALLAIIADLKLIKGLHDNGAEGDGGLAAGAKIGALGQYAPKAKTPAPATKTTTKTGGGTKSGTTSHTTKSTTTTKETYTPLEGSIDAMNAKIKDLQTQFNQTADQAVRDNLKKQIEDCNKELDKMRGKVEEVKVDNTAELNQKATNAFEGATKAILNPQGSIGDNFKGNQTNWDKQQEDFQKYVQQYDALMAKINEAKDTNANAQEGDGKISAESIAEMESAADGLLSKINEIGPAIKANLDFQYAIEQIGEVQSVFSDMGSITSTIEGIANGWADCSSALDVFTNTINTAIGVLNVIATTMTLVNTLQQIFGATSKATAVAEGVDTGAKIANAIATDATAAAETPAIELNKQLTASYLELASAEYMAAHASIPFVGFAIGAGFAAAAVGVTKAIGAMSFADGGVISGNHYTSDAVPIMANAGEIVLNNSQQENLASNLQNSNSGMAGARTTISGEQIVSVVNAYGKRTGRGEILR